MRWRMSPSLTCTEQRIGIDLFPSYQLRWLNTVFKKMENLRFRCVFLDNYYLLINKKYLTNIKQHLKSLNFCTKVTQLPLLWQQ